MVLLKSVNDVVKKCTIAFNIYSFDSFHYISHGGIYVIFIPIQIATSKQLKSIVRIIVVHHI